MSAGKRAARALVAATLCLVLLGASSATAVAATDEGELVDVAKTVDDLHKKMAELRERGRNASRGELSAAAVCEEDEADPIFSAFGDTALYTPAPGGDIEQLEMWTVNKHTRRAENSPFGRGAASLFRRSRGGDLAGPVRERARDPTIRLFAANTGGEESRPRSRSCTRGSTERSRSSRWLLRGGAEWAPTSVVPVHVNMLGAAFEDGLTAIAEVQGRTSREGRGLEDRRSLRRSDEGVVTPTQRGSDNAGTNRDDDRRRGPGSPNRPRRSWRNPVCGGAGSAPWPRAWNAASVAAFVMAVAGLALLAPSGPTPSLALLAGLVAAYALASRVEFEIGSGSVVPTQIVLVPMLFVLPPGSFRSPSPRAFSSGRSRSTSAARSTQGASPGGTQRVAFSRRRRSVRGRWKPRSFDALPVLAVALAAQFALELVTYTARDMLGVGVPIATLLRAYRWVFTVDSLLTPIGFLVAVAGAEWSGSFLPVLPLVVLLRVFALERTARIDQALELTRLPRHRLLAGGRGGGRRRVYGPPQPRCRRAVLGVVDRLGLDSRTRQRAEFAALLHDVGKIRIPNELIHKPGPLDADEWASMRRIRSKASRCSYGSEGCSARSGVSFAPSRAVGWRRVSGRTGRRSDSRRSPHRVRL